MTNKFNAGRFYYESLRDAGTGMCAYCDMRAAETLDHYCEKSDFPLLAVVPSNLIPACRQCNSMLEGISEKFHPYLEDISNDDWLVAKLLRNGNDVPGAEFRLRRGGISIPGTAQRVAMTFKKIDLGTRWSTEQGKLLRRTMTMFRKVNHPYDRMVRLRDWEDSHDPQDPPAVLLRAMQGTPWFVTLQV